MDGNSMTVSNIGKTSVNTGELKMEATLNEHNEYEKSFLTPQKKTSTVGKYSVFNQCGKAIILTPDIVDGKTSIGEKALECSDEITLSYRCQACRKALSGPDSLDVKRAHWRDGLQA